MKFRYDDASSTTMLWRFTKHKQTMKDAFISFEDLVLSRDQEYVALQSHPRIPKCKGFLKKSNETKNIFFRNILR